MYTVAFSPEGNGRRLISGGHDLSINIYMTNTGELQERLKRVHRSYIMDLRWRKDALVFASASGDRTVGLWRGLPRTWCEYVSIYDETGCVHSNWPPWLRGRQQNQEPSTATIPSPLLAQLGDMTYAGWVWTSQCIVEMCSDEDD